MSVFRFLPFPSVLTAALLLSACGDKAEKLRTYPLGEKVYLGQLVYTAFETQWLTQIPQDPLPRIPQSRFFLVRISAVNSGSDDLIVPSVSLEDDHGKTYDELTNGEGVPQWIGALRQVKPADSVAGNIVFDAPPGHYKMRVTDETSEKASLIDIPLTYGSETPEVPIPGSNADKTKK